jgi:hypothetical protein
VSKTIDECRRALDEGPRDVWYRLFVVPSLEWLIGHWGVQDPDGDPLDATVEDALGASLFSTRTDRAHEFYQFRWDRLHDVCQALGLDPEADAVYPVLPEFDDLPIVEYSRLPDLVTAWLDCEFPDHGLRVDRDPFTLRVVADWVADRGKEDMAKRLRGLAA